MKIVRNYIKISIFSNVIKNNPYSASWIGFKYQN